LKQRGKKPNCGSSESGFKADFELVSPAVKADLTPLLTLRLQKKKKEAPEGLFFKNGQLETILSFLFGG
jgi:hypothetical protein